MFAGSFLELCFSFLVLNMHQRTVEIEAAEGADFLEVQTLKKIS